MRQGNAKELRFLLIILLFFAIYRNNAQESETCENPSLNNVNENCTNGYVKDSQCTFLCKPGYSRLDGRADSTICVSSEAGVKWNPVIESCEAQKCEWINDEPVEDCTNENNLDSICQISCSSNSFTGKMTCTINDNGDMEWHQELVDCTSNDCGPLMLGNGDITCDQYTLNEGTKCNGTCHKGYVMDSLKTSHVVTCIKEDNTQKWNENFPKCERKSCPDIDQDTIVVKCDDGYYEGTKCTIACRQGYDKPYQKQFTTQTSCVSSTPENSEWSPPIAHCEELTCLDAQRKGNCTARNRFGSKCEMTCEADGIEGTSECVVNEMDEMLWAMNVVACNSLQCVPLWQHNGEGDCNREVGSVCEFKCITGYTMPPDGQNVAKCEKLDENTVATWNTTISNCLENSCGDDDLPMHTLQANCSDDERTIGTVCTYSCQPGFVYPEQFIDTLECVAGNVSLASWNNTLIPCIEEDECASNPCTGNWTCRNLMNSYECVCISTNDTFCELGCASNPCLNGGTCTNIYPEGYECTCFYSQSGDHCQIDHRRFSEDTKCDGTSCLFTDERSYSFIDVLLIAISVTVAFLMSLTFWVIRERLPLSFKVAFYEMIYYILDGIYHASKNIWKKIT